MYHSCSRTVKHHLDGIILKLGRVNFSPAFHLASENVAQVLHRQVVDIVLLVDDNGYGIDGDHLGAVTTAKLLQALLLLGSQVMGDDNQVHFVLEQRIEGIMLIDILGHNACLGVLVFKHSDFLLEYALKRLVTHNSGNAASAGALGHLVATGCEHCQHCCQHQHYYITSSHHHCLSA